jgi:hypothetical protein
MLVEKGENIVNLFLLTGYDVAAAWLDISVIFFY